MIGDFGADTSNQAAVAAMVTGWNPDFIVTTGDNYYADAGGTGTGKYDIAIGKYYCAFLKDITTSGTFCPTGMASVNRFFTSIGDHDLDDAGHTNGVPYTYLEYVNLPGDGFTSSTNNERYYDFVQGPVHFFVLNSDSREIDGATNTPAQSAQAKWLQTQLGASTSTWNVVISGNPALFIWRSSRFKFTDAMALRRMGCRCCLVGR
ncbi:MAG: hypothetical protein HC806_07120 [Anaerolineae bacterium]|nr:hypothetical protein [Anaerolineae bacterium]